MRAYFSALDATMNIAGLQGAGQLSLYVEVTCHFEK
jgi:hypothetical protein